MNNTVIGILVVALFIVSLLSFEANGKINSAFLIEKNDFDHKFIYHLATKLDIQDLMKSVGIHDPNKNYNIIYEGYGTGLAPPTENEWYSMVDRLKIVENISSSISLKSSLDLSSDRCFPYSRFTRFLFSLGNNILFKWIHTSKKQWMDRCPNWEKRSIIKPCFYIQ